MRYIQVLSQEGTWAHFLCVMKFSLAPPTFWPRPFMDSFFIIFAKLKNILQSNFFPAKIFLLRKIFIFQNTNKKNGGNFFFWINIRAVKNRIKIPWGIVTKSRKDKILNTKNLEFTSIFKKNIPRWKQISSFSK